MFNVLVLKEKGTFSSHSITSKFRVMSCVIWAVDAKKMFALKLCFMTIKYIFVAIRKSKRITFIKINFSTAVESTCCFATLSMKGTLVNCFHFH